MAGRSVFEAVTDLEPVAGGVLEEHRIVVWRSFAGGPLDVFCTDLMEQPGDPVDLRGVGCPERDSILIRGMQRRLGDPEELGGALSSRAILQPAGDGHFLFEAQGWKQAAIELVYRAEIGNSQVDVVESSRHAGNIGEAKAIGNDLAGQRWREAVRDDRLEPRNFWSRRGRFG